jgi:hypothetical protein
MDKRDYVTETGTGEYCIMYWDTLREIYVQGCTTYRSKAAAKRALAKE